MEMRVGSSRWILVEGGAGGDDGRCTAYGGDVGACGRPFRKGVFSAAALHALRRGIEMIAVAAVAEDAVVTTGSEDGFGGCGEHGIQIVDNEGEHSPAAVSACFVGAVRYGYDVRCA